MHYTVSYTGLKLELLGLPNVAESETDDDSETDAEYALTDIENLNVMQRYMYDIIMNNVNEVQHGFPSQCRAYFLDGPGGIGKTMLYNTVISTLSARHLKVHFFIYVIFLSTFNL